MIATAGLTVVAGFGPAVAVGAAVVGAALIPWEHYS